MQTLVADMKQHIQPRRHKREAAKDRYHHRRFNLLNIRRMALSNFCAAICAVNLLTSAQASEPLYDETAVNTQGEQEESGEFHFTNIRTWAYRNYLPKNEEADVLGFEFNSAWSWGDINVSNISYFEIAQYPRAIPGWPVGNYADPFANPNDPANVKAADGISDLLTAFLFSKQEAHHTGPHHFSFGFAAQFPTASDESLGSGKWSFGPAFEYEYENGAFYAAFVALQLWSVAGDDDQEEVNMLMIKPMVTYEFVPNWKLVYMPYGITHYWNKPSGQNTYLPIGGGLQYEFDLGGVDLAASLQGFEYVVRSDKGPKRELRGMLEIKF